ncbi:hypothetical protein [Chryseobacterium lathyri]|uniref:hypothetical protein n=1 Tax=Chryseobacterium lathyri TaxID=395933 RepID=UPI001300B719|nr:hypothetical protein [Chryseobacterium lathyri]
MVAIHQRGYTENRFSIRLENLFSRGHANKDAVRSEKFPGVSEESKNARTHDSYN